MQPPDALIAKGINHLPTCGANIYVYKYMFIDMYIDR